MASTGWNLLWRRKARQTELGRRALEFLRRTKIGARANKPHRPRRLIVGPDNLPVSQPATLLCPPQVVCLSTPHQQSVLGTDTELGIQSLSET